MPDPNRENEVILFKSYFANSNLSGSPDDPPEEGAPGSCVVSNGLVCFSAAGFDRPQLLSLGTDIVYPQLKQK